MRRVCKLCRTEFDATKYAYYCPSCAAKTKAENVVRQRTCRECGTTFPGGPRAWYCPDCREVRRKAAAARFRGKGCKADRPLGSIDKCVVCGADYTVESARQKYCKACAVEAVKDVDRPAALKWNQDHKDTNNPARNERRRPLKHCVICGAEISGGGKTTCSPECAKKQKSQWQAIADYKRGKRKTLPPDS